MDCSLEKTNEYMDSASSLATDLWVNEYENTFTKKSLDIIKEHRNFFNRLSDIESIVVIGHSLAKVDYLYFEEICKHSKNKAHWYIGYYSLDDLKRVGEFMTRFSLDISKVILVRF